MSINNQPILIIGDIGFDLESYYKTTRPIPSNPDRNVVLLEKEIITPGLALNTAVNCNSIVLGFAGYDWTDEMTSIITRKNLRLVTKDVNERVTIKQRLYIDNELKYRLDKEEIINYNPEYTDFFLDWIDYFDSEYNIVILSDYAKGTLFDVELLIKHLKQLKKLVIVDPKGTNWQKYRQADIIKANLQELNAAISMKRFNTTNNFEFNEFKHSITKLTKELELNKLIVTAGQQGVYWNEGSYRANTNNLKVTDVNGCGDHFIATLATELNEGNNLSEAIRLANESAGMYCCRSKQK